MSIEQVNFKACMEEIFYELKLDSKNQAKVLCPFHADSDPSLSINLEAMVFNCFGCGKKGNAIDILNEIWECGSKKARSALCATAKGKLHIFDKQEVERYHSYLLEHKELMDFLTINKGLSDDTIDKYNLGYDQKIKRYIIPIYNKYGHIINLRQYSTIHKSKMLNASAQINIFPQYPVKDKIYICEGEWDCMLLRQYGYEAITSTGGAGTWFEYWNEYLRDKQVFICYDGDEAGVKGSKKVASSLSAYANEIFIIDIPLQMDVSDVILQYGIDGFQKLKCDKYEVLVTPYEEPTFDYSTMDLKELIRSFHMKWHDGLQIYKAQPQVEPTFMIERVVEWFKEHGGKFVWDECDDIGYLCFDGKMYPLLEANKEFKALMQGLGGLSSVTQTGKIIINGLIIAPKYNPDNYITGQWIASNPSDPYEIFFDMHDKTTLSIKPNNVSIISSSDTPIIQFQMKKYFKPFKYLHNVDIAKGIELLQQKCMRLFMLDDILKDMLICWLFSSIIASFSTAWAGIRLYGEADTGKSTILELMYILFFGDIHGQLPHFNSAPALWRAGRMMPILFFDNQNVGELSDSLRNFFNASVTGFSRVICDTDRVSIIDQKSQTLVAMTGLDSFMNHDTLTRYLEIPTNIQEKGDYYGMMDRVELFKSRNYIMSSMINVIANKIIPTYIKEQDNVKKLLQRLRSELLYKSRISEYLVLMIMLNIQLHIYNPKYFKYSVDEWIAKINEISSISQKSSSQTMEWWQIFYEYLNNNSFIIDSEDYETRSIIISQKNSIPPFKIKCIGEDAIDMDRIVIEGIMASQTEQLTYFRTIAKTMGTPFPFKNAQQLGLAYRQDTQLWKNSEWKYRKIRSNPTDLIEIIFPQPIIKKR